LANKGHYPAINVLKSVSRLMNHLAVPEHQTAANTIRNYMSTYVNAEDLINIGAYKKGASKEIDEAIDYQPEIIKFLQQGTNEQATKEESIQSLINLAETGEFR